MGTLAEYPLLVFPVSFLTLWVSAWIGTSRFTRLKSHTSAHHDDFALVQNATLTLLALVIGFAFSMAMSRYDQRKNLEEEEANAIGTAYVRADFLPGADAASVRGLLQTYLDHRVLFYTTNNEHQLHQIDAETARLQAALWAAVRTSASAEPTPITALVVQGMNDVLNSQGYTLAAWRNRIPPSGWALMAVMAVFSTMLVGVGVRETKTKSGVLVILPLVIAFAFTLVADIDSPRRGIIRVSPQNLLSLAQSLRAP